MAQGTNRTGELDENSRDPQLVRFTERVTDTPDPDQASRIADMLLLFLTSGGTILGSMLGGFAYLVLFQTEGPPTFVWLSAVIASVAFGGACGCGIVMAILRARQMIAWEHRRGE